MSSPHHYLSASMEELEVLSVEELIKVWSVASPEGEQGPCGSCRYGLESPCTCGYYEVTREMIDGLIEYKRQR